MRCHDSAQEEEDAGNVVAWEEDVEVGAQEEGTEDAVAQEDGGAVVAFAAVVDAQEAAAVRCKLQVC